jgi:hypothetical protein
MFVILGRLSVTSEVIESEPGDFFSIILESYIFVLVWRKEF